jgi:hypothetical protein
MKKRFIWALMFAALAFQPSVQARQNTETAITQTSQPNESDLQEHNRYTNKSGNTVHSPSHSKSGAIPNGATAQCGDGSYSFSQSHRGTCSHHGGVGQWLN